MERDPKSVLDAVLDGVVVVDGAGRVELSNAEACRILGTSSEATLGQPLGRLVGSRHALLALVESGRSRDEAYRIVQQAAQRAWEEGIEFRELLADAPDLDLDAVFDPDAFVRHAQAIVGRLDRIS